MILVVCIDDHGGMLFNKRRQSKDRALRADLLKLSKQSRLWMNAYSAAQFADETDNVLVDEDFLEKAESCDYCFVENLDITPYADSIDSVILYRWNRIYPSDVKFPMDLFSDKWELVNTLEFSGFSHEVITREVYHL